MFSSSKALNYFRARQEEICCAFDPSLICRLNHRTRLGERVFQKNMHIETTISSTHHCHSITNVHKNTLLIQLFR